MALEDAVIGELYAFSASWVSAAVRLRKLDFRQAQAALHGASGAIEQAAGTALAARNLCDLHTTTPVADTVSAVHERASTRLFTT